MKIAMTPTNVRLTIGPDEVDRVRGKLGEKNLTCAWSDKERTLTVYRANAAGDALSGLRQDHPTKPKNSTLWVLAWARGSLPHEGKRFPTFGACPVEKYTFHNDQMVVLAPPEELRPRVKKVHHGPRRAAPEVTNGEPVGVLERVRFYLHELNEIKATEPGLTFKVKADGLLGFEFISDESP